MLTVSEVADLIRHEMRSKLDSSVKLEGDTKLDDLGITSLQISDIVFTLEEKHGVEFDPSRAADGQTIGDVVTVANEAIAEEQGARVG